MHSDSSSSSESADNKYSIFVQIDQKPKSRSTKRHQTKEEEDIQIYAYAMYLQDTLQYHRLPYMEYADFFLKK